MRAAVPSRPRSRATVPPVAVSTPGYPVDGATYTYASKIGAWCNSAAPATPVADCDGVRNAGRDHYDRRRLQRDPRFNRRQKRLSPPRRSRNERRVFAVGATSLGQALEKIGEASSTKGSAGQRFVDDRLHDPGALKLRFHSPSGTAGTVPLRTTSMRSGTTILDGVSIKIAWGGDVESRRLVRTKRSQRHGLIFAWSENVHSTASVASDGSATSTSWVRRGSHPPDMKHRRPDTDRHRRVRHPDSTLLARSGPFRIGIQAAHCRRRRWLPQSSPTAA